MATNNTEQVYVTISALEGGHLTLPERLFVTDADPEKRSTVPSLSFLIRHPSSNSNNNTTNLIFDLGIKRNISGYAPKQQDHIAQRQPVTISPDVSDNLRKGGLDPAKDVDIVILSHVHWDHVGTPSDFSQARFVVGSGTLHLLANGAGRLYPVELFNKDELPIHRTEEFPPVPGAKGDTAAERQTKHTWTPLAGFPNVLDFFGDGSVWVIDSPGHLYGHVNLLAKVGANKWVYLGGDCCHDPRLLTGEKGIALYDDGHGGLRSVHVDTDVARSTLDRIQEFIEAKSVDGKTQADVEVVIAHDKVWREKNGHRFFPGTL